MKKGILTGLFIAAATALLAQRSVLENVWITTNSETRAGLEERVDAMVDRVVSCPYRSDVKTLRALFNRTHKEFLQTYTRYAGVEELAKGRYDCLTATSLFADVLQRAGFKYNIIETNYHIFLTVKTSSGEVLLETTDRYNGFVSDSDKINQRIEGYKLNDAGLPAQTSVLYTFALYQSVNPEQLAGLLYFNQAVKAFNNEDWQQCSEKLLLSGSIYASPRVAELGAVLYHTVASSNLSDDAKAAIRSTWKRYASVGTQLLRAS